MSTSRPTRSLPTAGSAPTRRFRSPFWASAPSIVLAMAYAAASLTWVVAGDVLPGGRWLAVHLFTLGVLSNLVMTFSQHFASTVTHAPGEDSRAPVVVFNLGALPLLFGLTAGVTWVVGVGATVATAGVLLSYRRIRTVRRNAIGARFGWIVRVYERAHGAFVHGAILGALMGTGVLSGEWYATARLSHLHVNVLGWGGLTLLATLVFFGPSMARTRIVDGADARAARALKWGATALTVGVLALLASAVGGAAGTALRVVAGVGLGVFATVAGLVLLPVAIAANRAPGRTAAQIPIMAVSGWAIAALVTDAVAVTLGSWSVLDVVGFVLLVGVLGQSILTTLTYLAPMMRGRTPDARTALVRRVERGATGRAVLYNAGVLTLVATYLLRWTGTTAVPLSRLGWTLVIGALLLTARAALSPVPKSAKAPAPTAAG